MCKGTLQAGRNRWLAQSAGRVGPARQKAADVGGFGGAEDCGFDIYHPAEHHGTPLGLVPSPSVFLAAMAMRTSRIWLSPLGVRSAHLPPDAAGRRDRHAEWPYCAARKIAYGAVGGCSSAGRWSPAVSASSAYVMMAVSFLSKRFARFSPR